MDGNKDEALRCVRIAEEAIATGNKTRALKFIRIAQRLNNNLPVDALLSMCDRLDSQSSASSSSSSSSEGKGKGKNRVNSVIDEGLNGKQNYTDENVKLVREIKLKSDYYAILGVEKSCSVEEIRKAYRKLSLKVHPDKNKAPGSEEAFKKVSKAFKCLSDDGSRRQYDQTGLVDEFEYNQQYNVPRRRRRAAATARDFFEEDFDPEEIFRAFFGQSDVFGRAHVYRTRGTRQQFRGGSGGGGGGGGGGGLSIMLLVQLLPFLIILLVAYLPFSEPEYSLLKTYSYQVPKTTENYGVQFFVKSDGFDHDYPQGSPARAKVEDSVIKDYRNMLRRYCQIEVQRRSWNRNLPTPHCEKLQSFDVEA